VFTLALMVASGAVFAVLLRGRNLRKRENAIREARAMMSSDLVWRRLTATETDLAALLQCVRADEQALEGCGFTILGDVVMEVNGERVWGVMRALVDASNTACAYLVVPPQAPSRPTLLIESYTRDEEFMTLRGSVIPTAQPPFSHRQVVTADTPCDVVVARHRELVTLDARDNAVVRIRNLDELTAELGRKHTLMVGWREARSPEALLEADLRALLGADHERDGARWARRLVARLPSTRARR
jgi:hypothetical protein